MHQAIKQKLQIKRNIGSSDENSCPQEEDKAKMLFGNKHVSEKHIQKLNLNLLKYNMYHQNSMHYIIDLILLISYGFLVGSRKQKHKERGGECLQVREMTKVVNAKCILTCKLIFVCVYARNASFLTYLCIYIIKESQYMYLYTAVSIILQISQK